MINVRRCKRKEKLTIRREGGRDELMSLYLYYHFLHLLSGKNRIFIFFISFKYNINTPFPKWTNFKTDLKFDSCNFPFVHISGRKRISERRMQGF